MLGSDGTDVGSEVDGLRIAITTENSSAESMSCGNSLLIGGVETSIFVELNGPDDFWDRFSLGLNAGSGVSASLACLEARVSIVSE